MVEEKGRSIKLQLWGAWIYKGKELPVESVPLSSWKMVGMNSGKFDSVADMKKQRNGFLEGLAKVEWDFILLCHGDSVSFYTKSDFTKIWNGEEEEIVRLPLS
jgi:hypothetical protein